MWIAKPVEALTEGERGLWRYAHRSVRGPLSQGLPWAEASRLGTDGSFVVFHATQGVGGVVFRWRGEDGRFQYECVNGPLLDWDDPKRAPEQLATFVHAVSKLGDFGGLSMRPRWEAGDLDRRLGLLPIEPFQIDEAATIRVDLATSRPTTRLVRAAARAEKAGAELKRAPHLLVEDIETFARGLQEFSQAKGFQSPPPAWFARFLGAVKPEDQLVLERASVAVPGGRTADVLVAREPEQAFYLFGWESGRGLSASPLLHLRLMGELALEGVPAYDLGGYVQAVRPGHPYAGVADFKRQFGGEVVAYAIPEFRIA